jgi:tape measure domain-containing protein
MSQQMQQAGRAASQVQQGLNGIAQTTGQVTQAMQAATVATTGWTRILQVAAGVGLATTLQAIVQSLANFVRDSVLLAAKMQDLHRSFVAIEGSAGAANRTMAGLFDVAQRSGVSFTGLAESFRRLEAGAKGTTLSHQDLQRAMEGITLGARVMGLGTQENARAMTAWEQILTKGRLSSEELVQQLGEAVPGALNIVSRSLGVTTAQLRAMAEAGLIPGTVAFVAFSEEMRKIGQSTGAIVSLSATFERLKNETTAWMTVIGESIANKLQPFLDKIVEISQALRELLGIRGPGQAAPGAGPATAEGTFTARTQFPIAPSAYTGLIQQEARRSAIDPGLLSQVVRAESGFNPAAVSSAGALGLGQVMLPTAQGIETGVTRETLLEPERNLRIAAKYLADMLDKFRGFNDQVKLALAAYNAGPGTVENALNAARRAGTPTTFEAIAPQLPRETQQYVGRVVNVPGGLPAEGAAAGVASVEQQATATNAIVTTWQKNIADTLTQFGVLQQQVEALNQSGANFGGVMNRDVAQAAERVVQKLVEINQAFATLPALSAALPASLREQVIEATRQAVVWKEVLLTDQQRATLLQQQVEAMEQVVARQQTQLVSQRQGQEEAERFARAETARLQAQRLEERPARAGMTLRQQIAADEQRLQALQNRAAEFSSQLEAQRAEAMRPQLESQLQRIQGFLGRPEQSLAEQARQQVVQRGAAAQAELVKLIQDTARHPALQDLQEAFQNAFRALPDAVEQQSERAFAAVERQGRETLRGMEDQMDQLGMQLGAAGLDPLASDLARIDRSFAALLDKVQALDAALEKLNIGGTAEQQAAIYAARTRLATEFSPEQIEAGRQRALIERQEREGTAFDLRLRQQLEQAQLSRIQQPEARMRAEAERARVEITPEREAQLQQLTALRREQERLNEAIGVWRDLSSAVGSAWSAALTTLFAPEEDQTARVMQLTSVTEHLADAQQRLADLRMSQGRVNREGLGAPAQENMRQALADQEQAVRLLEAQRRALEEVEHGTNRVAEAFRVMAQSIIQSMAQIASDRAVRAVFELGARVLTSLLMPAAGAGLGAAPASSGGTSPFGAPAGGGFIAGMGGTAGGGFGFQHGGIVRAPTVAMVGENPSTAPEAIFNRQQLQSLFGGQAANQAGNAGISIINVASKAQAETTAAQERAMGRSAVINYVLDELNLGEGSRINRTMRSMQR